MAGAGTGKTHVIVEHIGRLLEEDIKAEQILAITFTEKAASEMQDRVIKNQASYHLSLPILTYNAFGESLLREFSADIGLGRNFLVMNENSQLVFLRERLDELGLGYFAPVNSPDSLLADIAKHFSMLKQNLVWPDAYKQLVGKLPKSTAAERLEFKKYQELANAYNSYLKLCRQHNVIDFDDQIFLTIELLKKRPNVLSELQKRFHTILVDEFQDTNKMQSELVDLLSKKVKSLIVVGDDDQSIYGFRGATLYNILSFKKRYPRARQVALTQNYRSSQAILDAAYRLIQNNNPNRLERSLGINKKLSASKAGKAPIARNFVTQDEESHWIANDIKTRLKNGQQPGSIAVLARRKATAELISDALSNAGVDHVLTGQRYNLYKTAVVRSMLELMRCITDPFNNLSLYHALTGPVFSQDPTIITKLMAKARRENLDLESEILNSDGSELKTAIEQINVWRTEATSLNASWMLSKIITTSGYKQKLYQAASDDPETATVIGQLSEFFKALRDFESIAVQPSIMQFLEALPALEAAGDVGEDDTLDLSTDKVSVLTIHKAKGLEWQTVYIPDCVEGSFPIRPQATGIKPPERLLPKITDADDHIAEERRLMYVAMTRAKKDLMISFADKRKVAYRRPSRFVAEIFGNKPITYTPIDESQLTHLIDTLSNRDKKTSSLDIPKNILNDNKVTLSVSQVVCFLNSPQEFYNRYILRMPEEPDPRLNYGIMVHEAIESINLGLQAGKDVDLDQILTELNERWPKVGYLSALQRRRAIDQATRTVKNFYNKSLPYKPTSVEKPFTINLPEHNLAVRGRYDVVFETEAGTEIRDYKTSANVDNEEKAKARARNSQQLTLYALAWQTQYGELPTKLSLEFVDTGIVASVGKTERGIESMKNKLAKIADAIRNGDFETEV